MISDKMVEAAFRSEMPDALSRVISRRHIRALLTAALSAASCNCPGEGRPAASGAHPDALPDGTLSKSTAKRVTALAAASVSERARDMVTALYGDKAVFTRHDVARAIEQALTQQRGEPVFDRAWVVRDAELRAAAYNLLNLVEGVGCERWQNANGFRLKDTQQWVEFYIATKNVQSFGEPTTPQPSASVMEPGALRALVAAANAVLAENPADDGMWTLEQAVRPFNATMPAECANGCPTNQVCDYCQYAPQPSADAVREDSARLDWIESQIREYGDCYTEPREAGLGIQWQQERPDHYCPGLRAWIDEERRRASGDELESLLSAASGEKGVV